MNRHRQSDPEALLFDFGNVLITVDFERVLANWGRSLRPNDYPLGVSTALAAIGPT